MNGRRRRAALATWPSLLAVAKVASLVAAALGACTEERLNTGARCDRNSECAAPLVCRLDRCRRECNTTRDCPVGFACVLDADGLGACQGPGDKSCTRQSDCAAPLICRFEQCVNECAADRDCPAGSLCMTDGSGGRACIDTSGKACVRHEECAASGQTCALDGRCRDECVNDRDCRYGTTCCMIDYVCHDEVGCRAAMPRDAGPPDAGPRDAGGTDAGLPGSRGLPNAIATTLSCRGDTTCVGFDDVSGDGGGFYCWGRNDHGQLGLGTTSAGESIPQAVGGASVLVLVGPDERARNRGPLACDGDACCARGSDGADDGVYCWGRFADFETGTVSDHLEPVLAPGVTAGPNLFLAASGGTFCASHSFSFSDPPGTTYGNWCWGDNTYGQIGDGTTSSSFAPVAVLAGLGISSLVGGGGVSLGEGFGCADAWPIDGSAARGWRCWGRNDEGQLLRGTVTPMELVPAEPNLGPIGNGALVALGRAHGCISSGITHSTECWGSGELGQVGDGTRTDRPTPVEVIPNGPPIGDIPSIDCAGDACCTLRTLSRTDRQLLCWGEGPGISAEAPTSVDFPAFAAPAWPSVLCLGLTHACVAVRQDIVTPTRDTRVFCWGDNTYGQLGDGTMGGRSDTPVEVIRMTP